MARKFKLQDGIDADPSELESARDYNKKLQDLGRSLLAGLYMLVRNVKLYEPTNVIFDKPLQQLTELFNTLIAMEGEINLQCAGDSFYLNNMLLRVDQKSLANVRQLTEAFEQRDVGGFGVDQRVNVDELRNFIYLFGEKNTEPVGERGVSSRKLEALKLRRFEKLQEIIQQRAEQEAEAPTEDDQTLDRKRYGLVVYARTVIFMRSHLAGIKGEGPEVPLAKATHLIQDLVDVCHGHRTNFLGVTSVDKGEEYVAFHAANVALLSIVFGGELGLPKERLRDLGIAALFHDVGLCDLPEELIAKGGKLTPAEKRQLKRAPILGALRLLRDNPLNARTIQCALASFYSAADWGQPIRDHLGELHHVKKVADLGLFDRIIALADTYDRLVFQQSLNPDLALALMNSDLIHRFDPDLLRIFNHLMKGYSSRILSGGGERLDLF